MRLDVAVKTAFPAGGITVAGLRKEIARGRLEVEKIAGKLFTTLGAIARMRQLCRVESKESPSAEIERDWSNLKPKAPDDAVEAARLAQASLYALVKSRRRKSSKSP